MLSEKKDGSMKVLPGKMSSHQDNRRQFFAEQGIVSDRVVSAGLIHGTNVEIITSQNVTDTVRPSIIGNKGQSGKDTMRGAMVPETDGLVTKETNLFLAVTVADCLPVFFYDPVAGVVGIAHAGWRGIAGGVIHNVLEKMRVCGAQVQDMVVVIGPHIGVCHFEVQADILHRFSQYEQYSITQEQKIFINLKGIAVEQLRQSGILESVIETYPLCTFCEAERFFSYRRDRPEVLEVMVAMIGMQEKT